MVDQAQPTPLSTEVSRAAGGNAPMGTGGVSRSEGGRDAVAVDKDGTAQPVLDKDGKPVTQIETQVPAKNADGSPKLDAAGKPVMEAAPAAPAAPVYTAEQQAAIADPKGGKFAKAFIDNGALSETEIKEAAVAYGVPEALVRDYVAGQQAVRAGGQPSAVDAATLAAQQANASIAFEFSGDMNGWNDFAAWTQGNLTADQRSAIESAVANGHKDPITARAVISNFYSQFKGSGGEARRDVTQGAASAGNSGHSTEGYASQQEMVDAMHDRRYNRDKAYTEAVTRKVGLSRFT